MSRVDRNEEIIARSMADREGPATMRPGILGRLWREHIKRLRAGLGLGLFLALLGNGLHALYPLTLRYLTDSVLVPVAGASSGERFGALLLFALFAAGLWAVSLGSDLFKSRLIITAGQRLILSLRRALNQKLNRLDVGYFDRNPSGRIMSRVLDEAEVVRQWVAQDLVDMASSSARILCGLTLLFWIDPLLALGAAAILPAYHWLFRKMLPRIRRVRMAMSRLNSSMYARAAERILAVSVVKSFARETSETLGLARTAHDHVRVSDRMIFLNQLLSMLASLLLFATTGGLLWIAVLRVRSGAMSLGDLVAFYTAAQGLYDPTRTLVLHLTQLEGLKVALSRIYAIIEEPEVIVSGELRPESSAGLIEFKEVTFKYPGRGAPSLEDISFILTPGMRLAVMGPSGAGKTTLLSLMLRFHDAQSGTISLDGTGLQELQLQALRRHIRLVQQDPFVFSGTLADNVRGAASPEDPELETAASLAALDGFISELPEGWDTQVGERGITLSGGQKQRLTLAAALLAKPAILLLDDITSALDADTESRLRLMLRREWRGRTCVLVTQRASMAADCDAVLVLEEGRITGWGTPAELAARPGFFQSLCQRQGAGFSANPMGRSEITAIAAEAPSMPIPPAMN